MSQNLIDVSDRLQVGKIKNQIFICTKHNIIDIADKEVEGVVSALFAMRYCR